MAGPQEANDESQTGGPGDPIDPTATPQQAPAAESHRHSWLRLDWPGPAMVLLTVQLLLLTLFSFLAAGLDLIQYSSGVSGAFAVLYWTICGFASLLAWVAVTQRTDWVHPPLLAAEGLAILNCLYVLWVDVDSAFTDVGVWVVTLGILGVAVATFIPLASHRAGIPTKASAAALALISTFGLSQFVLQNQIIPARSRPDVAVQAKLTEVGRTGHLVYVRGTLEWQNEGLARVAVPAAYATVIATGTRPGPLHPMPAERVMKTLNPLGRTSDPYEIGRWNGKGKAVIWFDDVASVGSLAPPGVTAHSEFLLTVDDRRVESLELQLTVSFISNDHVGAARTCDTGTTVNEDDFMDAVRRPITGGGYTESCLRIPFKPSNWFRDLTADDPAVLVGYTFVSPREDDTGPFTSYVSDEGASNDNERLERANARIDTAKPSLIVATNSVLALHPARSK